METKFGKKLAITMQINKNLAKFIPIKILEFGKKGAKI